MTLNDLSQLYYLRREIESQKSRAAHLRSEALRPAVPSVDGMPRAVEPNSRTERIMAEIDELERSIETNVAACVREYERIEHYIQSVDDSYIRSILRYRFVNLMTWQQIAFRIGGNNTADSVRKACNRFLKKPSFVSPKPNLEIENENPIYDREECANCERDEKHCSSCKYRKIL